MFDQLIAKPAAQAPAKSAPATRKGASATRKGTSKGASKPQQAPAASGIKYAVQDFARPVAGSRLAAHTAAFLSASGMIGGGAFPKAQAAKIIGARAVQYHTSKGNFVQTAEGLKLTDKGVDFFVLRPVQVDQEALAAYESFFANGQPNESVGIKGESHIVKL